MENRCSVVDCDRFVLARGWCGKHYQRWQKYGDPQQVSVIVGDDVRRFWSYVARDIGDHCWLWIGARDKDGYGVVQLQGKARKAHRVAWNLANGRIPDGLCVCHSCDVRNCCRPSHLWLGTNDDNMNDCTAKGRRPAGERNGTKTRPERVARRGDRHASAVLTPEQVAAVVAEYKAGQSAVEVGKRYGVSRYYVTRVARDANAGRGRGRGRRV